MEIRLPPSQSHTLASHIPTTMAIYSKELRTEGINRRVLGHATELMGLYVVIGQEAAALHWDPVGAQ